MKRVFTFIFVLFVIGIVAAGMLARARAPSWLKEKIISGLTNSCPKCKVGLDSVEVSFLEGRIVLHDFEFVDAPDHASQVALRAHLVAVDFDPKSYMDGLILIRHIRADDLNFTLIEDSKFKSEKDDDSPPFSELPEMVVQSTEVYESSFRYLHKVAPHEASLQLTKIHGSLGSWVTRPALEEKYAPHRTSMSAWGVLERSGTFEVRSEFEALSKEGTLELDVTVENQELAAVSDFFVHECGFALEGLILKVSTHLDMKKGKIDGTLKASYSGLKLKVENPKNSGVKNFFETVGADIVIAGEQGVNGKPPGQKIYHDERTANQSLFSAMFHALGGASKELVK
jgi:hypothetical protein